MRSGIVHGVDGRLRRVVSGAMIHRRGLAVGMQHERLSGMRGIDGIALLGVSRTAHATCD